MGLFNNGEYVKAKLKFKEALDVYPEDTYSKECLERTEKEIIREKLENSAWTIPYPIESPIETILPRGLRKVIGSWEEKYNKELEGIIKQRK